MFLRYAFYLGFTYQIVLSNNKQSYVARRRNEMDDTYQDADLIGSFMNLTLIECTFSCMKNPSCVSFFHNTKNKNCLLHLGTLNDILTKNDSGWQFYTMNGGKVTREKYFKL